MSTSPVSPLSTRLMPLLTQFQVLQSLEMDNVILTVVPAWVMLVDHAALNLDGYISDING
jgi:hypothetical protein